MEILRKYRSADRLGRKAPESTPRQEARQRILARMRRLQKEDGVRLSPALSAQDLARRWAAEDEAMTPEQLLAEYEMWSEIERDLQQTQRHLALSGDLPHQRHSS